MKNNQLKSSKVGGIPVNYFAHGHLNFTIFKFATALIFHHFNAANEIHSVLSALISAHSRIN